MIEGNPDNQETAGEKCVLDYIDVGDSPLAYISTADHIGERPRAQLRRITVSGSATEVNRRAGELAFQSGEAASIKNLIGFAARYFLELDIEHLR